MGILPLSGKSIGPSAPPSKVGSKSFSFTWGQKRKEKEKEQQFVANNQKLAKIRQQLQSLTNTNNDTAADTLSNGHHNGAEKEKEKEKENANVNVKKPNAKNKN